MARRRKGDKINGWINLDKPEELGSTPALGKVRRLLNAQKAGHAGTLDPLASGILPIALGEATKTIQFIQDSDKEYEFEISWGVQTSTDDREGEILYQSDIRPTKKQIEAILSQFTGDIEQIPPQFSAIKVDGERAYDLARDGENVDLQPRRVHIQALELLEANEEIAKLKMTCGKGTYVRSLARDMGLALSTYAHIKTLRRTRVGPFTLEGSISLAKLEQMSDIARREDALLPLEVALDDIPALNLRTEETAKLRNGQELSFIARPDFERLNAAGLGKEDEIVALALYQGNPIAIVQNKGPQVKPLRVLNL